MIALFSILLYLQFLNLLSDLLGRGDILNGVGVFSTRDGLNDLVDLLLRDTGLQLATDNDQVVVLLAGLVVLLVLAGRAGMRLTSGE